MGSSRARARFSALLDRRRTSCHSAVGNPVGIPIILGASEKIRRTGETFRARCPACGKNVKFYEAVKHLNVSAFLAISLWDEEDPIVQCGECLAAFGEDDGKRWRALGAGRSEPPPALRAPSRS